MVRTVKTALRKTLGKSSLSLSELITILTEIEAMTVNSRPIAYLSNEGQDPLPLCRAHFLIGRRMSSLPLARLHLDSNFSSRKELLKYYNYKEQLMRLFWSRWRYGLEWLNKTENFWPKVNQLNSKSFFHNVENECKSKINVNSIIINEKIIDFNKYSSLKKLLRVTAYVFRFINLLRHKQEKASTLTLEELRKA